jgi:peptidylprolyl isomerase
MQRSPNAVKVLIGAAILLVAVVAVVLIARGGGDGSDTGTVSSDLNEKPTIDVPSGSPPAELVSKDIVTGDGATAEQGDTVKVQYVGVDYATGKEFDSSWDSGQPFTFQIGAGNVIPGWDQGVEGMQVGGRRELIVPPGLAYGAQGSPPAIAPNATLVFAIDLLDVQSGGGSQPAG